jgi:CheY-like chemotaxis protein
VDRERQAPRAAPTLLLIEDDPATRFVIGERLRAEFPDLRVIVAESGEAGLELAARTRPTIIVLDLHLRGIEGFEVARRIRATASVPIVLLTADARQDVRERALREGFEAFLLKPEGLERLPELLRRFLAR